MILEIKKIFKMFNQKNSGQAMMVVVLALSAIIIGATAVSGLLTSRQTRQTADSGFSASAIFAADAGLEWRMYKLYSDWKAGNLSEGNCSDCGVGLACDKQPDFNIEKINNISVNLSVVCTPITPAPDPNYIYFKIISTAKAQDTSYSFQETIKLIK